MGGNPRGNPGGNLSGAISGELEQHPAQPLIIEDEWQEVLRQDAEVGKERHEEEEGSRMVKFIQGSGGVFWCEGVWVNLW